MPPPGPRVFCNSLVALLLVVATSSSHAAAIGYDAARHLLNRNGNLPHAVDFRSMYATALEQWWGVNSRDILGERFATLDVLRAG